MKVNDYINLPLKGVSQITKMMRPAKILMTLELFDLIRQFIPEEEDLIWSWGSWSICNHILPCRKQRICQCSQLRPTHHINEVDGLLGHLLGREEMLLQDRQDQIDALAAPPPMHRMDIS